MKKVYTIYRPETGEVTGAFSCQDNDPMPDLNDGEAIREGYADYRTDYLDADGSIKARKWCTPLLSRDEVTLGESVTISGLEPGCLVRINGKTLTAIGATLEYTPPRSLVYFIEAVGPHKSKRLVLHCADENVDIRIGAS